MVSRFSTAPYGVVSRDLEVGKAVYGEIGEDSRIEWHLVDGLLLVQYQ